MADGPPKTSRDSLLPVLMVLAFGLAIIVGVIAVTGVAGLFVVLALGSVLGFAAFHYVLWGWWLTRRIRDAKRDDDRADGGDE